MRYAVCVESITCYILYYTTILVWDEVTFQNYSNKGLIAVLGDTLHMT